MTETDAITDRRRYAGNVDLVLAGGGVKGIAHVGAIRALQAAGYARHPRIAGTSVGSIVGGMIVAGYRVAKIEEVLMAFDFTRLRGDRPKNQLSRVLGVRQHQGAYSGDGALDWIARDAPDLAKLTFGTLMDRRRAAMRRRGIPYDGSSPLVIMATDITNGRLAQFPRDYADHYGLDPRAQRVVDAIRASISIPLYFEPARIADAEFVDGGVLANFAVDVLDRPGNEPPLWPTFGITLMKDASAVEVGGSLVASIVSKELRDHLIGSGFGRYIDSLVGTLIVGQDQDDAGRWWMRDRTVQVDTGVAGIVEFDVDEARKAALLVAGRSAAEAFLLDPWQKGAEAGFGFDGRASFPLPPGVPLLPRVG